MEKNNTLSIIALIAIVTVVGIVVAFAVSSKGNTQPTFSLTNSADAKNAAGQMMEMDGDKCTYRSTCDGGVQLCVYEDGNTEIVRC